MTKLIRVAMIMGKMNGGGVESVVMNYYRHIDRTKVQFDFIIDSDSLVVPEEEIISLGGKVYKISPYQKVFDYMLDLEKILKKEKYIIVHSHINALSVLPLRVAKKCGIPVRIAHNHSTAAPGESKKNIIKYIFRLFATLYPTHYMSPTLYAGEWLFGGEIANNELFILKNAINIDKFVFDSSKRKKMRKEIGYSDDDFVIGNIGRMVWQKNQQFVIKIFSEVRKIKKNAKLLIIGEGPLKSELVCLAKTLNLTNSIKFVSNVQNVEDYYQAMDFFLFPSNYEGLGMVAIEAQTAGLPTLVSTSIPQDVKVTKLCHSIDLNEDTNTWAEVIINSSTKCRTNYSEKVGECGYDIKVSAKLLANQYKRILENA